MRMYTDIAQLDLLSQWPMVDEFDANDSLAEYIRRYNN